LICLEWLKYWPQTPVKSSVQHYQVATCVCQSCLPGGGAGAHIPDYEIAEALHRKYLGFMARRGQGRSWSVHVFFGGDTPLCSGPKDWVATSLKWFVRSLSYLPVVSDMMPMACMPSASPLIILIEGQCSVRYFHIEYSRHPEFNGGPIVNSIKQY